jgi:hypothetical protein
VEQGAVEHVLAYGSKRAVVDLVQDGKLRHPIQESLGRKPGSQAVPATPVAATPPAPVAAAGTASPATKETADSQATIADIAKVDDLFSSAGKPVTVWLTRQADGTWYFKPDQEPAGAIARIQMAKNDVFFDVAWKPEKDATPWTFSASDRNRQSLKGRNLTLTAMSLPNGKMMLGMTSKRLYAGRFRFVYATLGTNDTRIFFLEELGKPSK